MLDSLVSALSCSSLFTFARLSARDHDIATQRVATSLRSDASFMEDLKRRGLLDEDPPSVIEDVGVNKEI